MSNAYIVGLTENDPKDDIVVLDEVTTGDRDEVEVALLDAVRKFLG